MPASATRLAVIYRWRLRKGMEHRFETAWKKVTEVLRNARGALGSRLHRAEDGTWVAYAQWPDKETWERSRDGEPIDPAAFVEMREATEESFEPVLLHTVRDMLGGE